VCQGFLSFYLSIFLQVSSQKTNKNKQQTQQLNHLLYFKRTFKLFVEALARKTDFPICTHDFQTSSTSAILPGFVDLATSVVSFTSESIEQLGSKALAGGITLVCLLSDDQSTLSAAKQHLKVH
jgi:hypothetical protein